MPWRLRIIYKRWWRSLLGTERMCVCVSLFLSLFPCACVWRKSCIKLLCIALRVVALLRGQLITSITKGFVDPWPGFWVAGRIIVASMQSNVLPECILRLVIQNPLRRTACPYYVSYQKKGKRYIKPVWRLSKDLDGFIRGWVLSWVC